MRWLTSALLAASLAACQANRAPGELPGSPTADIPIKRVVLYQNGVGYFERQGIVDGNVLSLQIRPSQINDLLKSLTIVDTSKGRAISISLPLEKSGDRVLAELPDQVRNARGVLDVLSVFRGARVELEGKRGSVTGRVVGVENLERKVEQEVVPDWRVTLRTDEGKLVVYPVRDITGIEILDRTLAVGLEESLDVSLNEGEWKPITLSIRLAGDGEHPLLASYIVEMPRWKPAYRIVTGADGALLQGWAVIDNVSGEDWRNVQLSLVAGAPLSFIYDLHSSQYIDRADLSPRGRERAAAPPVESGGVEEVADAERTEEDYEYSFDEGSPLEEAAGAGAGSGSRQLEKRKSSGAMSKPSSAPPPPPVMAPAPRADLRELLEEQAGPTIEVAQLGSLFRYDIADPVTVPDRSSTLVAIVNQRVTAEDVVFFRPEHEGGPLPSVPYRAVKLTNDTPLTLEKGPVTLYSKNTFVGEGFIDRVQPGSTHFVSYSRDGKVSLNSDYSTEEQGAKLVRISDGQIVSEVLRTETTTYTIKNLHEEAITAYVKTDRRADWKLSARPHGTVETSTALMVPVQVPAKKSAELPIAWEKTLVRHLGIDTTLGLSVLQVYLQGGKVPPAARETLQKVIAVKAELDEIRRETQRLRRTHGDASRDQDRVRANLDTLRKTKGNLPLQQELAKKLAKLETDLGALSGKLVALSERQAELEGEMNALIKTVSLSNTPTK